MSETDKLESLRVRLIDRYTKLIGGNMSDKKQKESGSGDDIKEIAKNLKHSKPKPKPKKVIPRKSPVRKDLLVKLVYYGFIDKGEEVRESILKSYKVAELLKLCDKLKIYVDDEGELAKSLKKLEERMGASVSKQKAEKKKAAKKTSDSDSDSDDEDSESEESEESEDEKDHKETNGKKEEEQPSVEPSAAPKPDAVVDIDTEARTCQPVTIELHAESGKVYTLNVLFNFK